MSTPPNNFVRDKGLATRPDLCTHLCTESLLLVGTHDVPSNEHVGMHAVCPPCTLPKKKVFHLHMHTCVLVVDLVLTHP